MRLRAQSKSSAEHNWTAIRSGFAAWKGFGFARDVSKIGRAAAHKASLRCTRKSGGGPPQSKTLARCPMTDGVREASWMRQSSGALGSARE